MFFDEASLQLTVKELDAGEPKCGRCKLYRNCQSPKIKTAGKGRKRIMVVAEHPTKEDDYEGALLSSSSGKNLMRHLQSVGISASDVWLDAALICHPGKQASSDQIQFCRPRLIQKIKDLQPHVVLLLGDAAIESVVGWSWGQATGGHYRWTGLQIPDQKLNTWICPTYNPSYAYREKQELVRLLFRKQVTDAVKLAEQGVPWEEVPDHRSQVELLYHPEEICEALQGFQERGKPIAFDYECNRLKPDHPKAKVYSLSVSDGSRTIAFPWFKQIKNQVSELLRSDCPKIASNLKFEDRWTRRVLGHGVRNWVWDTMVNAHLLDNRRGICSLKFQAYACLGEPLWNSSVDNYLEADKTNPDKLNRIDKANLKELLIYNGLDSLLEVKLAREQRKRFKGSA